VAMGTIGQVAISATQVMGRYFTIVSVLPSGLLVCYVYVLFRSDALADSVDWAKGFDALSHPGIGGVMTLLFASAGLAVVTHPVQFAIVQFFEGYWGNGYTAQQFRVQRIIHYQAKYRRLYTLRVETDDDIASFRPNKVRTTPAMRAPFVSKSDEAGRWLASYPRTQDHIMPTRLGNIMRRLETASGGQYELNATVVFPHIMLVAPPDHVAYVNDQRSQFDLALRTTMFGLVGYSVSYVFLWRQGLWLLVACIPYLVAYMSYRGSLVLARQYATAVTTVIDLNRFLLYERLRLSLPLTTKSERSNNRQLMRVLGRTTVSAPGRNANTSLSYKHPKPPDNNMQSN
jgi:hypothetical protein